MTTMRTLADYDASHELTYRNNRSRTVPRENHSNTRGVITKKTRSGSYNVIEKDFGDHKRIYHVPIEYGDNYDLSQLDEPPIIEEPPKNSSRLVRRQIYQEYDNYDDDDDYEYIEEVPTVSPRRRRNRQPEIVERVYETAPSDRTVEYIYEDDRSNYYEYRPENEEKIEYVVRETAPKTRYVDEPHPVRHKTHVEEPPVYVPSPRPVPPPTNSVRHSPPTNSVHHYSSPPPMPMKSNRFNELSPPPSHRNQQTVRSPVHEPVNKNEPPPLRLKDVIAQNRARRGARPSRPRREVDEAKIYDPPTYNRNIIKNGFIVHK